MKLTKENILRMLDTLEATQDESKEDTLYKVGYARGFSHAIRAIRFIVSVNMEEA